MAEIITKDSEEFKELAGWMKKIGRSVEAATARIRRITGCKERKEGMLIRRVR